jgi:hypothetical protein
VNAADVIIDAIRSREVLSLRYDAGVRLVEPYTFGVDGQGNELLCGYQTAGASASGKSEGWKFFHIANISNLHKTGQHFARPRPEYKPNDRAFAKIVAQV